MQRNTTKGLNEVRIKLEFYKWSSNLERNEFNIPNLVHLTGETPTPSQNPDSRKLWLCHHTPGNTTRQNGGEQMIAATDGFVYEVS